MLSKEEVLHIAKLANFKLSDKELETFRTQLSDILDYVTKLEEVDTSNINPISHTISELKNRFQEGPQEEGLNREDALKNADNAKGGYFLTKAVL